MRHVATLSSKSQITVPVAIRRQLGLQPGDRVVLAVEGDKATLRAEAGTHTDRLLGQGAELWRSAGGGSASLEEEREDWDTAPQ